MEGAAIVPSVKRRSPSRGGKVGIMDRIATLAGLLEKGLISEAQFSALVAEEGSAQAEAEVKPSIALESTIMTMGTANAWLQAFGKPRKDGQTFEPKNPEAPVSPKQVAAILAVAEDRKVPVSVAQDKDGGRSVTVGAAKGKSKGKS